MNVNEAVSLILQMVMRIFELVNVIAVYTSGNAEHVREIVEDNNAWIDKTMAELETQMMIDELYQ